jgi:hypothetical protein
MLNFSDDREKPDTNDEPPSWDQIPEPQIVEITPDSDKPALPPSLEQSIIRKILEQPGIMNLPDIKKPVPNNFLN